MLWVGVVSVVGPVCRAFWAVLHLGCHPLLLALFCGTQCVHFCAGGMVPFCVSAAGGGGVGGVGGVCGVCGVGGGG